MYTFTYIWSERLKAEYRDTAVCFFTANFLQNIFTTESKQFGIMYPIKQIFRGEVKSFYCKDL